MRVALLPLVFAACSGGRPSVVGNTRTAPPSGVDALFALHASWSLPCWSEHLDPYRSPPLRELVPAEPVTCVAREVTRVGRADLARIACTFGARSTFPGGWYARIDGNVHYLSGIDDEAPPRPTPWDREHVPAVFSPGDEAVLAREVPLFGPRRIPLELDLASDRGAGRKWVTSRGDAGWWCTRVMTSAGGWGHIVAWCIGEQGLIGTWSGEAGLGARGTRCGDPRLAILSM